MNTRTDALTHGLIAGLIGYGATVVFFSIASLAAGRSVFHTPSLLGSWLFYELRDLEPLVATPGPVLAYNGVHMAALIVLGMLAALAAVVAERRPPAVYPLVVAALASVIGGTVMLLALTAWLAPGELPWWSVGGAVVAAALAMFGYLGYARPGLRAALRRFDDAEEPTSGAEPPVEAWQPRRRMMIDSLLWAAAHPAPRFTSGTEFGRPLETRLANCSTLRREVRLAWSPPARHGAPPREPEVVCLDCCSGCTSRVCPLFGLPTEDIAARLGRSGLHAKA